MGTARWRSVELSSPKDISLRWLHGTQQCIEPFTENRTGALSGSTADGPLAQFRLIASLLLAAARSVGLRSSAGTRSDKSGSFTPRIGRTGHFCPMPRTIPYRRVMILPAQP